MKITTNGINLFLDDIRHPHDALMYTENSLYNTLKWDVVRSYDEFVKHIENNGIPDIISFDHDLADEHYTHDMYKGNEEYNKHYDNFKEKTGFDCAKWLVDYCIDNSMALPPFLIHSMNPVGGENIKSYLNNFNKYYHDK